MKSGRTSSIRVRWNLHTVSLIGIVLSMGYAGAVQNNGAAYLLCFVTAVLAAMTWLRARENLRGVQISMGRMAGGKAGEVTKLPLELRAATGQGVWGVEVMAAQSDAKWSFIEEIDAGGSALVSVPVKVAEAGVQESVRIILRSSYPMGFFSAERVIEIAAARRIHPKAEGSLPLPAADTPIKGEALSFTPAGGRPGREGDDFAGLREWQPGDSLRHVDWRAVARGRPLLVKQWASGSSNALTMDWERIDLPDSAKAGQIARWIEEAELSGTPYALRLPGVEIDAGLGPAQAQRCLDALSEASPQTQETTQKIPSLPPGHERSAHLPPWPLLVLCLTLGITAMMLMDIVPVAAVILFVGCVVWRLRFAEQGWKKSPTKANTARANITPSYSYISVGVLLAGMLAVQISTGNVMSMEGGIAVLLVLLGGKLLESRTPHDFQVLSLVGWFLCLCSLLTDQSLSRSLWTFALFATIGVCMVRFRRGADGWLPPLKLTGIMLAQALPVAAVLFIAFPRSSIGFLGRFGTQRTHVTGISSSLEPGRISEIAKSDEVSFRAEFPNSAPPENFSRYWRCLVLWQCDDGLSWQKGSWSFQAPSGGIKRAGDVQQIITLEPHGQRWLPALDVPIEAFDEGRQSLPDYQDDTLTAYESVDSLHRFEVHSRLTQKTGSKLTPTQRAASLRLPEDLSPRVRALGQQFKGKGFTDVQIAQRAVEHLQAQGFQYTLEPGVYEGPQALEEFIFDRRVGFCEHFSAAFATLMRAAGVPARIVIGYMGGEWSPRGGYMIVRQSDAHAWTELWIEGQGWTRVDPTAALVPGRMTLDLRTLLAGGEEELERQRESLLWRSFTGLRLWWDSIEYSWFNTVISFDEESQIAWMNWLGLGQLRGHWLMLISGGFMLVTLVGFMLWLRRPARVRDPWLRSWLQLCARLEKLGAPARRASEGPLSYAERVALAKPDLGAQIRSLAGEYAEVRYGPKSDVRDFHAFQQATRELR